jgi:hypothetical protein
MLMKVRADHVKLQLHTLTAGSQRPGIGVILIWVRQAIVDFWEGLNGGLSLFKHGNFFIG